MAFGVLEGKKILHLDEETKSEWEKFKENRFTYHIPQAENYTDVIHRIRPFVEKILQNHQGEEILIVGHRVANQMLIGILMDYPSEKVLKIQQSNDCLCLIKRNGEAMVFHYMNGEVGEGFLFRG